MFFVAENLLLIYIPILSIKLCLRKFYVIYIDQSMIVYIMCIF